MPTQLSISGSLIRRWWVAPHKAINHFNRSIQCTHRSAHYPVSQSIQQRSFGSPSRNRSKSKPAPTKKPAKKPSARSSTERLAYLTKKEQEKALFNPDNQSVGIFGRPNVGKSTLFNRLVGQRLAIIDSMPGVTRDRLSGPGRLADLEFRLIDTAGMETEHEFLDSKPSAAQLVNSSVPSVALQKSILAQTQAAMSECDVALFVIDARQQLTSEDLRFARMLRKHHVRHVFDSETGKMKKVNLPIVLIANKVETDMIDETELIDYPGLMEASKLGFGQPALLSAEHGAGLAALHGSVSQAFDTVKQLKANIEAVSQSSSVATLKERTRIHFAIVGRPNVGKSTLINALIGENRVLTGEQAGITRDSISIEWTNPNHPDHLFNLIDTAGIRGGQVTRSQTYSAVDVTAMTNSFKAISMSHVIALVLDVNPSLRSSSFKRGKRYTEDDKHTLLLARVSSMIAAQDWLIAKRVCDEGRALVIVLNKMDLLSPNDREEIIAGVRLMCDTHLPQLKEVPIIDLSARELASQTSNQLTNQSTKQSTKKSPGLDLLMSSVVSAHARWSTRFNTHKLNEWLHALQTFRPHPSYKGRPIKAKYIVQTSVRPPSFSVLFSGAHANKTGALEGVSAEWLKMMRARLVEEFQLHGLNIRVQPRRAGKTREERMSNTSINQQSVDKEGIDWNVQDMDEVYDDEELIDEEGDEFVDEDEMYDEDEEYEEDEAPEQEAEVVTKKSATHSLNQSAKQSNKAPAQVVDDVERDNTHDDNYDDNEDSIGRGAAKPSQERAGMMAYRLVKWKSAAKTTDETNDPSDSPVDQSTNQTNDPSTSPGFLTPAPDLALRLRPTGAIGDLSLYPFTSKSSFLPPEHEEKSDSMNWEKRRDTIQKHQKERTEHIEKKKGEAQFRSPAAYYKWLKSKGEMKEKWNRKQRKMSQGRIKKSEEKKRKRTGSAE